MNAPKIPSELSSANDTISTAVTTGIVMTANSTSAVSSSEKGDDLNDNNYHSNHEMTTTFNRQTPPLPSTVIGAAKLPDDDDDDDTRTGGAVRLLKHTTTTTTTTAVVTIEDGEEEGLKHDTGTTRTRGQKQRNRLLRTARRFTQPSDVVADESDGQDNHDTDDYYNKTDALAMNMNHQQLPSSQPSKIRPMIQQQQQQQLTEQDVALCQALDMEYDRAIEDRQVAWTSRYQSVRQSTVVSIVFMIFFICIGTIFFIHQSAVDNTYWSVSEGLLFSIYTITTVGYGHLPMPTSAVFQWYIIIYIFVGIATLTILVAQVYQCVALETNRVAVQANDTTFARISQQQQLRSKSKMRQWVQQEQQHRRRDAAGGTATSVGPRNNNINNSHPGEGNNNEDDLNSSISNNNRGGSSSSNNAYPQDDNSINVNYSEHYPQPSTVLLFGLDWVDIVAYILQIYDVTRSFLRENEFGRSISVILPFLLLITIGAVVIGPIEGWTVTESIYFSVVSLTTVGFGDYYPTKNSSIWFCCIWLPFSVGFMSLYLSNIAAFYIRLSDRNIARIENVLRKRIQSIKEKAQLERQAVLRRALRGQQQEQNHDTNPNDNGSNDGGSSTDDDLVFTTTNMERGNGDRNGALNNSHVPTNMKSKSTIRTARSLHSRRFFGFKTIPSDDRFDSDNGGGDPFSRDNSVHSMQNDQSNSIYSSSSFANTSHRRERILRNSMKQVEFARINRKIDPTSNTNSLEQQQQNSSMTMTTMKDVLRSVYQNNMIRSNCKNSESDASTDTTTMNSASTTNLSGRGNNSHQKQFQAAGPESEYLSVRSNRTVLQFDSNTIRKKPSFALRALVQERFAEIIATDIAGYHNSIEIKDCTLTVTIEVLKKVADKWLIPRRARKAFRAVAFEALYFVGEHGLITRGAEALFSLSPIEFHQIFSPLLASFGDVETMESWLEHTQALADVDLSTDIQIASTMNVWPLNEPPISLPASRDLHRSHSLPVTIIVPSQPEELADELPEIA